METQVVSTRLALLLSTTDGYNGAQHLLGVCYVPDTLLSLVHTLSSFEPAQVCSASSLLLFSAPQEEQTQDGFSKQTLSQ